MQSEHQPKLKWTRIIFTCKSKEKKPSLPSNDKVLNKKKASKSVNLEIPDKIPSQELPENNCIRFEEHYFI